MTDEGQPVGAPGWLAAVRAWWAGPGVLGVALALLLGFGAAAVTYAVVGHRSPTYLATTATLLDEPRAISASQDSGVVDKLSRLRFKYAGILRSDAVVNPVAAELDLPPGVVAGSLVSRGDSGSLLLFIGARAGTRADAVRLSNALATQLGRYVATEQAANGIAPRDRLRLEVVSPARGAAQVLPTSRQRYVSALGAGLAAAVVVLGAADLLRRRRT